MDRKKLLKTATDLQQPSKQSAEEFIAKSDMLAAEMNRIMASRKDVKMMVGEDNISMMEDNHRNHIRFLCSVFTHYEPEILVETVLWVYRAYRNHGFNLSYWPAQLDQWVQVFKTELTEECFKEVYPFYNWMIINQPIFVAESDKLVLGNDSPKH
jgi:hypothetical protein